MNSNKKNIRVAVAMSGGVDSSVAALLLKNEGYDVIGITAVMHNGNNPLISVDNAKKVCEILGISHFVIDLRKDFQENVIDYFVNSYNEGLTPNPCPVCNKFIKWGKLREAAHNLYSADYIATGHYADIVSENGLYKLTQALDVKKDQLYMLYTLSQDDISKTKFPLANLVKTQVREIARANNLPIADNKESQDVCFIEPPLTAQQFLTSKIGEKEGKFVSIHDGKILGTHTGYYKYTIGQRKGIGISAKEPLYVAGLKPCENIVYLCSKDDLYSKSALVNNINWSLPEYSENDFEALCKIRYNSPAKLAKIKHLGDNSIEITFNEAESAITPGQMAVIYSIDNKFLIGGGLIFGVNE